MNEGGTKQATERNWDLSGRTSVSFSHFALCIDCCSECACRLDFIFSGVLERGHEGVRRRPCDRGFTTAAAAGAAIIVGGGCTRF